MPFYFFTSFSAVTLTPFTNKPDPSRDSTIFMMSFKFLFENTFSFETLLANDVSTFLINSKPNALIV